MNTTGSAHTIAAIEIDMRDLLRAKKSKPSNEGERALMTFLALFFGYQVDRFRR